MKAIVRTLAAVAAFAMAGSAAQAANVAVSGVTASSTYYTYNVQNLINGSGLTGGVHDGDYTHKWMTDQSQTGWLVFDLGSSYNLTGTDIWNYNGGCCGEGRSAKDLRISTSLDGVTYTTLGDYVLGNTSASDFTAQQIAFSSLARYVRFDLFSNYEDGIYTGLSEVQFQGASAGAVPEPATWAMMITGFGLAGTALRRRRSIAAAAA